MLLKMAFGGRLYEMQGIAGLFGIGGGAAGTSFAGPGAAAIQSGVNPEQTGASYNKNDVALNNQNALLTALQNQGGIGNQNQVYNQLQGIASGAVNPAQAQFAQNTAANVAQQGALMAGQRGASQNAGLIARQAGQQGAAIQQQAAGQEATQQAQNQIAAIGQAGQLANTQAGQQIGQTNANAQSNQAEQANLLNALGQQNQAVTGSQGSINSANSSLANTQMGGQQSLVGGLLNSVGGGAKAIFGMADGGVAGQSAATGPQSSFGKFLSGVTAPQQSTTPQGSFNMAATPGQKSLQSGAQNFGSGIASAIGSITKGQPSAGTMAGPDASSFSNMASKGGRVDVVVSPGEKIATPKEAQRAAQGGKAKLQTVPGRASVSGDSSQNDTVPTKLPVGSVVVKRTRANNDPDGFIREVLSKRKGKK